MGVLLYSHLMMGKFRVKHVVEHTPIDKIGVMRQCNTDHYSKDGARNVSANLGWLRSGWQSALLVRTTTLTANRSNLLCRRLHTGRHQRIRCRGYENCARIVTELLRLAKWSLRSL